MNAAKIQFISFRTITGDILLVNQEAVEYIYTSERGWSLHLRNGERVAIRPSKVLIEILKMAGQNYKGETE